MVSDRQITANRRNASNSTGPKSRAGKKRASQNAYRHGLTLRISGAAITQKIEKLARKIAGRAVDPITLEFARTAAEAELELARVRQVRIALIQHVSVPGPLEQAESADDSVATLPAQEPERSVEALRRVLSDLVKLQRYEFRAATRRDRAIQSITLRCLNLAR
jgi:hypothetical protein